jgi:FkbM family methyltransferase
MTRSYFKGQCTNRAPNAEHQSRFSDLGKNLCVYDLGSTGGTPPPFCHVLDGIELVNFEPDYRGDSEESGRTLSVAIGPPGHNTIYLNKRPTTSSLLRPQKRVVDRYDYEHNFKGQGDIFETVDTATVQTLGLDEAVNTFKLDAPDFLKIDVQGLGLEVLETGVSMLEHSVLGLQIEVEFVEFYTGQKTFGAVQEYLYARGFEVFEVTNVYTCQYRTELPLKRHKGQHVFCDLLYLKSIDSINAESGFWTSEKAVSFIQLCLLYDLTDYAAACLEKFKCIHLVDDSKADVLMDLISEWIRAIDYFYEKPQPTVALAKSSLNKALDLSLRILYRRIRAMLK